MSEKHRWSVESPRSLGAALRTLRQRAGRTQIQLADELGTSRDRLSRMEKGEFADQTLLVLRILKRFGASLTIDQR
jgi:transcriptional regulator with XRE-family HTH domain